MKRPGNKRRPDRRWASVCSCCLTPAATSSPCARKTSTTAGELGAALLRGIVKDALDARYGAAPPTVPASRAVFLSNRLVIVAPAASRQSLVVRPGFALAAALVLGGVGLALLARR